MKVGTYIWIAVFATPFMWAEATLECMADRQVQEMQAQMEEQERVIAVGNADFVNALAMSKSQPKQRR